MSKKVLITAKEVHELIPLELTKLGYQVDHLPEPSEDELFSIIDQYEGLIVTTYTKVHQKIIDQAVRLKFVGRVGAGLENIDTAYALQKNIQVFSSPEGNANAVGEHALAILLNLMNHITTAHQEVLKGIWQREENRGEELDGKTVGIIGFGNTGSAFAKKLRGFDVNILAYDKFKTNYGTENVKEASLEQIQAEADIISLHIPYSTDNHHFVSQSFFSSLKKSPYLIHTCRGEIIDFNVLADALDNKLIKGAAIDVFEDEPWTKAQKVSNETYLKILNNSNVIATPHIAGWTLESKWKLADILMKKISTWKDS